MRKHKGKKGEAGGRKRVRKAGTLGFGQISSILDDPAAGERTTAVRGSGDAGHDTRGVVIRRKITKGAKSRKNLTDDI